MLKRPARDWRGVSWLSAPPDLAVRLVGGTSSSVVWRWSASVDREGFDMTESDCASLPHLDDSSVSDEVPRGLICAFAGLLEIGVLQAHTPR